jgi:hypothetical protein
LLTAIAFGASLLVAPNAVLQSGHEVRFPLRPEKTLYDVRGRVVRNYIGGKIAPEIRRCELSGTYAIELIEKSGEWLLIGASEACTVTDGGKELSPGDSALAKFGKWTFSMKDQNESYTWDNKIRVPSILSLPFWPIGWRPILPAQPLKIGDLTVAEFQVPLQSFLEDDPIGSVSIPITYRFDGPTLTEPPCFRFFVETKVSLDRRIDHPEDRNLKLVGEISIQGVIDVNRTDGRVESASLVWSVDIGLDGPGYAFGFSKCKLTASANLRRVR